MGEAGWPMPAVSPNKKVWIVCFTRFGCWYDSPLAFHICLFVCCVPCDSAGHIVSCLLDWNAHAHRHHTRVGTLHRRWIPGPRLYGCFPFVLRLSSRLFERSSSNIFTSHLALYLLPLEAFFGLSVGLADLITFLLVGCILTVTMLVFSFWQKVSSGWTTTIMMMVPGP
jgi:hypothetical protein